MVWGDGPQVHILWSPTSSDRLFYSDLLLELGDSIYHTFGTLYFMKSFHIHSHLVLMIVLGNRSCYSHL